MSGFCDFCQVWHSGSCCNPRRAVSFVPYQLMGAPGPAEAMVRRAVLRAIELEREQCAKTAEAWGRARVEMCYDYDDEITAKKIAAAIRRRGE